MRIRCNTQILQCDGAIGTNAAYLEPPPEALVVSRDRNTGITFVYEYGRGTAVWEEALEGIRVFYYSRNGTRTNTFRCLGGQTACSQDTGRSHLLAGDECVFNIFQNLIFSVFVEYLMPGRRCTESRILTPGASLLPRAVCLTQYAHGYVVGARTPIHNRPFCPLLAHTGARVVSPPPPTTSDADPPSPVPSRQSKRPNTPPPSDLHLPSSPQTSSRIRTACVGTKQMGGEEALQIPIESGDDGDPDAVGKFCCRRATSCRSEGSHHAVSKDFLSSII